ncbi:MAG: transglutaminase domain-containing protein [Calditrichaeota bacterium]|nr:transglutaminase domain-containing protein [Calditrichota bacterium]
MLHHEICTNPKIDALQKLEMEFEIERLDRIRKDFTGTRHDIIEYVKNYVPDVSIDDLEKWEQQKALEFKIIDGEKKYFQRAAPNLFRIDKKLKQIKLKKDGPSTPGIYNRLADVRKIIRTAEESGKKFVNPVRVQINYSVTVKPDVVPDGEVIRCWLPFPREISGRQTDIKLVSSFPDRHLIAPNDFLQRTIYFEQTAEKGKPTKFQIAFEFTNHAVYNHIDPEKVVPAPRSPELLPFLSERPPHIVFNNDLRQLSRKIVGDEKNPYRIAQKIFRYISENIPWASAREYSTIPNISEYVYQNHHCDCGMHSIFFITLCRMNGIPARWQSGWTTKPGSHGMHDWGEIYFEPYGWLPVDADIGVLNSENEEIKWFFLGSMDAYRLIVNDGYSQPLYPAKIHFRSETVDFQRGELEWRGGNLYFDQWDWDYQVEFVKDF